MRGASMQTRISNIALDAGSNPGRRVADRARAVGFSASGALALGVLAVGAFAIGRLVIGRARIRHLEIDELVVRKLRVIEPSAPHSTAASGTDE